MTVNRWDMDIELIVLHQDCASYQFVLFRIRVDHRDSMVDLEEWECVLVSTTKIFFFLFDL